MLEIDVNDLRSNMDLTNKRTNVFLEIVETEQNFTNLLQVSQDIYRKGLKDQDIFTGKPKCLDLIFGGLGSLMFNTR
jgi:hypothetical protein